MSERQEPTAGSKSQLKKQAKMLHKQQAKAEHAARGHSAMLHEARRLRERLNSDAAVDEAPQGVQVERSLNPEGLGWGAHNLWVEIHSGTTSPAF